MVRNPYRRHFLKGTAGAATALIAGCGGKTTEGTPTQGDGSGGGGTQPKTQGDGNAGGGALTLSTSGQVSSMDPHRISGGTDTIIGYAAYDQVAWTSPYTGEVVPQLAKSLKYMDEQQTTLRMKLREGVTFHNGDPLTPEDVVFSFKRMFEKPKGNEHRITSPQQEDIPNYESIEKVSNQNAVDLHVTTPDPLLKQRVGGTARIVNKKWVLSRSVSDVAQNMNGTAQYKLDKWTRGSSVEMSYFDDFWGAKLDSHPGKKDWTREPPFKKLRFIMTSESQTRTNQLLAGETDVVKNVPVTDISRVEQSGKAHISTVATDRDMFFAMRNVGSDDPPTKSRKFRLAMNYAISTKQLVEDVLQGYGKPLAQPVPDYWTGHLDAEWSPYGYPQDLKKAERLVEESGRAGAKFTIVSPRGHYLKDTELSQAVAGMINQLSNVSVDVKLLPTQDWINALTPGTAEKMPVMYLLGWGSGPPDGTVKFAGTFDCRYVGDFTSYCNQEVSNLVEQAFKTADKQKRIDLIHQMVRIVHNDAAAVFTHRQAGIYGLSNRVSWQPAPDENLYPELVNQA